MRVASETRPLPYAAFIAFTGTPTSFDDGNAEEVFGRVIDTYDLTRAVDVDATVQVYFEPSLIQVRRADELREEDLNNAAEEALADDLLARWEVRSIAMRSFIELAGKAFVVGETREICARRDTRLCVRGKGTRPYVSCRRRLRFTSGGRAGVADSLG